MSHPTHIKFTIPGKPQPKQRARSGRGGQFYTPTETRAYMDLVGMCGLVARVAGWPMDARYKIRLELYYPDRRRRDGDNVMKAVKDGLNGILWEDDSQVYDERTLRCPEPDGDPRAVVSVEVLDLWEFEQTEFEAAP
jgi:Holliday junction resolvase RusA-like endonuclease